MEELTIEEIGRIMDWYAWTDNEGSMSAYGPESDALVEKLNRMRLAL